MNKAAAPKINPLKAPAVKPNRPGLSSSFQPSAQMPWAGQRGTLEDLSSFGVSPEEFFGGGGRLMFSDTAPKTIQPIAPKQGALRRIEKKALTVATPNPTGFSGRATSVIANTIGRAQSLPTALLVGQEKFLDHLKTYDKDALEKEIEHLKSHPALKNTMVRINHGDIGEDYRRLYSNPNKNIVEKALGSVFIPITNTHSALTRNNHYNALTDTAQIYGHVPEIVHHELGHARDFNKGTDKDRASLMSSLSFLENQILNQHGLRAGPFTQRLESAANAEAAKGYRGDMKEFRRRLWPARGTYWTALAGGLAMLNPSVREKVYEFVNPADSEILPDDDQIEVFKKGLGKSLRGLGLGFGITGAGALGGRLFAEYKNLEEDRKNNKIKKASMNMEHGYAKGFIKRAYDYGFTREEALTLLKQAVGELPMASKKKVVPPVKVPSSIKGNANDIANPPRGPLKPLPADEQF